MEKDKQLQLIEQVMADISHLIDPEEHWVKVDAEHEEEFDHVINKEFREKFIMENPKCFLPLSILNVGIRPFFPICNRGGMHDKKLIEISRKMAERLLGDQRVEQIHLRKIMAKLIALQHAQGSGLGPI